MATHSSVLAWRIPGTGEPVGLPSVGSHRVGHDSRDLAAAAASILKQKKISLLSGYPSHGIYLAHNLTQEQMKASSPPLLFLRLKI